MSLETQERDEKEKNAGEDSPKGSFGKGLHDLRITLVPQIDPDQDQGAGERHHTDQPGRRRQLFGDCGRPKNNDNTQNDFDKDLHR